jgi:4-carboxymuconolactone decarboxylase
VNDAVRALVRVSIAIGSDDRAGLVDALHAASRAAGAIEIEEALLQSYLFAGYPRTLQAFKEWRSISPSAASESPSMDEASWAERGSRIFGLVYGAQHEKLLENVASLHPDLERWMLVEGYGKVLGRPGLDLPARELCIIALLATQDAVPQLYSHLRGALHVGADASDVAEVLDMSLSRVSADRAKSARDAWAAVSSRRGG